MSKISPENLVANSSNLDGLVANYDKALGVIVEASDLALGSLANWHQNYRATEQKLEPFLKEHEEKVVTALKDTARRASGVILMVPEVLHGLPDFSRDDRMAFKQAQQAFSLYSAKSDIRRHVSSGDSLQAMYAALDRWVLKEVNGAFSTYSAKSEAQRYASSIAAAQAMFRIVDPRVYKEARDAFSSYSAKSEVKRSASADPARLAMEAALDGRVVRESKKSFSAYSARSELRYASANLTPELADMVIEESFPDEILNQRLNAARQEFRRQFNVPPFVDLENLPSRQTINEIRSVILQTETEISNLNKLSFIKKAKLQSDISTMRSYLKHIEEALAWAEANPQIINHWRLIEQDIRSPRSGRARAGGSSQRQSGPRQSDRTRTSRPRPAPESKPEEAIFHQAEARLQSMDRSLAQTLRSYPRNEVFKIIKDILARRQAAVSNGGEITDREILIGYMKISNNNPNATPDEIQATQIVLTMMGNKVSGKLPF